MEVILEEIFAAWSNILLAWTALFLVAIAPGPTAMAIMGISMSNGRRSGFLFTSGCMSGAATWAVLAGAGLSIWLTSYANSIIILKIIGGLYLIWMAVKSFKSALTCDADFSKKTYGSNNNLFIKGLALHLTNPKAILGWAAVITLSQTEANSVYVLIFTLIGCLIITICVHFAYAFLFASTLSMKIYKKARRWIETVLCTVFGYAGARLVWDEIGEH